MQTVPSTAHSEQAATPPVERPETHSGETLMIVSYVLVWVLLLGWVVTLWRKQAGLAARLDGLEKALAGQKRKD